MAYDNNVPQANQTIAQTQPIINGNFAYIQQHLQDEHDFNGNVPSAVTGVHKQASMPNRIGGDPGALPAGTNGMYYVNGGAPKFYNGTTLFFIPISTAFNNGVSGTVALTTAPASVFTIPAFSSGQYFLIPPGGIGAQNASAMGQFVTSGTTMQLGTVSDPGISITDSGLTLQAATTSGALNGNYKFVVVYYTP